MKKFFRNIAAFASACVQKTGDFLKRIPHAFQWIGKQTGRLWQGIKQLPKGLKWLWQGIKRVPQGARWLWRYIKKSPQALRWLWKVIKRLPQGLKWLWQGIKKLPQYIRRLPHYIKRLPQYIKRLPYIIKHLPEYGRALYGNTLSMVQRGVDSFKRSRILIRLDRYIIVKFLGTYFFAILLIISIAVVFDFNEKMDRFMSHDAPWKAIIFDYYLNFIPYFANLFSPLFVFIAVIFFTSRLAENSEIIAMFSTGMSFKRMLRPYMISAAIIATVTFCLGAYVIPKGSITRLDFEEKYYKPRKTTSARNIQLEVDSGVIAYIERFEDRSKTGYRFSLDKFKEKQLVSHMTARSITYDTTAVHRWTVKDYMIRELNGMREDISKGDRIDTTLQMEPADLLIARNQQEMMTSPQLDTYIDRQRQRGFANIKEFEIEYHKRIAMSFASFILTLIGVSLSSRKVKGGMGLHLGIGLALSFSYILFQTIASTFAVNGNVPPYIAVWIPNILYAFIAFYLYKKAPK